MNLDQHIGVERGGGGDTSYPTAILYTKNAIELTEQIRVLIIC